MIFMFLCVNENVTLIMINGNFRVACQKSSSGEASASYINKQNLILIDIFRVPLNATNRKRVADETSKIVNAVIVLLPFKTVLNYYDCIIE